MNFRRNNQRGLTGVSSAQLTSPPEALPIVDIATLTTLQPTSSAMHFAGAQHENNSKQQPPGDF
jgi:hypothetical protein